jgi:nicotinamide-nucleotide amidase
MFTPSIYIKSGEIIRLYTERQWHITTAESCTGGLIAAALTAIPGSSLVVDRGFITYSDAAKTQMLDVPPALLEQHGAVSAAVAARMAEGARVKAGADVAVSATGVAGPGGGSDRKPVGLVFIGLATASEAIAEELRFSGDRDAVRMQTVEKALSLLFEKISR